MKGIDESPSRDLRSRATKLIFLSLALLLPVAIFIFLKIFGRNEFQVPVMHQDGNVQAPENCHFQYTSPYRIPDSVRTSLAPNLQDSVFVFYFEPSLLTAMKRVSVEFDGAPLKVVHPSEIPQKADLNTLRQCVLLMESGSSVAMVDHKNRIRGYYDGHDREEIDRLIVEIKIILKEY